MVCGDFNADLASDVALCDLLSEQGLLLASLFLGRGGDMKECIKDCKDWVGRCCGELFFVPFFCLKGCFFFFKVFFGKNDDRFTFQMHWTSAMVLRFRTPTRGQDC